MMETYFLERTIGKESQSTDAKDTDLFFFFIEWKLGGDCVQLLERILDAIQRTSKDAESIPIQASRYTVKRGLE